MYRKLLVNVLKVIVENDASSVQIKGDGTVSYESSKGFITEDGVYIFSNSITEEEARKSYGLPENVKSELIPLEHLNDIYISYEKEHFDEDEMNKIADEVYDVLGDKYDLMTVEAHSN